MNSITRFIRISLGLVFVIAGYVKINEPQGFALAVANYQLLPDYLIRSAAITLAWLEMLCGLALVFGILVRGASLIITLLMIIFLGAIGYNVQRGLDVVCGCFSTDPNGPPLSGMTLLRDIALLLAATLTLACSGSNKRKRY